ncbi:MAG: MaoC family dehydratase [Gracilimonas sp.]|nr:MaoC family dehydratase [Gracilimonas sp.]
MKMMTIHDLEINQRAEHTKKITQEEVYAFSEITGDRNPIHMDKEYAERTFFKKQIAHGALLSGLISAVFGMKVPGPGAIYEMQELRFLKPVYFGDEVTAYVEVQEINKERNRVTFNTGCSNQKGEIVAEGRSVLLPSKNNH